MRDSTQAVIIVCVILGTIITGFIIAGIHMGAKLAEGLENITVSVDKGTTMVCEETSAPGDPDTFVECRPVNALVDKERKALNEALDDAYKSKDKNDDVMADQICEFHIYKSCNQVDTQTEKEELKLKPDNKISNEEEEYDD